jgi:hypothetical protein
MNKKWVEAFDLNLSHENSVSATLSVPKAAEKKMNDDAWNYLVMACDGKPFNMITLEMEVNAHAAWKLLREEYEPSTDEVLTSIQEKFITCKMTMNLEDPASWIDKLKVIKKGHGGIHIKYQKGEIEMISYALANLP